MKQRFIEDKGPFSLFRLSLLRTGKKTASGNPLFLHLWSGSEWERYEYEADEAKKTTGFAYRVFPYPRTSQLIDIALESGSEDDIKGACRLLFAMEFKDHEYRSALIEKIEQSTDRLTIRRFDLIFKHANLINQGNLRDVMNKTDQEISTDLEFYQNLYQRTMGIKERIAGAEH